MPDSYPPLVNHVTNQPPTLGEKISDTATEVNNKLTDMGRAVETKIDENRNAAASGLQQAATSLHQNADHLPGVDSISGLAHGAADKLSATANYVRDHDFRKMMADVEVVVKSNPGPSLVVAIVIGFLAGRAFTGRD